LGTQVTGAERKAIKFEPTLSRKMRNDECCRFDRLETTEEVMRRTAAHFMVVTLVCFKALAILGCASSKGTAALTLPAKYDANVITEAQIVASQASTAYEAIERTRPRLLTSKIDLAHGAERQVYLNGNRLGGIDQLRAIPASSVREIRFVRTVEGGGPGSNNAGAAIVLFGRTGRR
jgi:hypothetical protein